jgi:hypothetical protein
VTPSNHEYRRLRFIECDEKNARGRKMFAMRRLMSFDVAVIVLPFLIACCHGSIGVHGGTAGVGPGGIGGPAGSGGGATGGLASGSGGSTAGLASSRRPSPARRTPR